MAGNRELFEQAMNDGHSAAWDQDWTKAIGCYERAIREIPDESEAFNSLGLALLNAKRFEDALKVYDRAHKLAANDPIPLEKSADVLERLGRSQEAAQMYVSVGDIYLRRPDLDKAIHNYEQATHITPGLAQIHFRLAQAYERIGQKRDAVREYLTLAFYLQQVGDKERATQAAERALKIEPNNDKVLNSLEALRNDVPIQQPEGPVAKVVQPDFLAPPSLAPESHSDGPLGEATNLALVALAELAFSGDFSPAVVMASQGIELQNVGEFAAAADAYRQAEASGMHDSALYIANAAALLGMEAWQDAETYFNKASTDKEYAAAAAHGLGKVYIGLGQTRKATEKLIATMKLIDLNTTTNADEIKQANLVYQALSKSATSIQENDLKQKNQFLLKWLNRPEWKARIPETRRALADHISTEGEESVWDYVQKNEMMDVVGHISNYMNQGLLTLAMDEAFYAIENNPTFLPVHQRIADILMDEGHIQQAIVKYNIVANSYLARDDVAQAAKVLNRVIAVAPTDTSLRISLIELLERQNETDKVLDEYISLANAYYQLADLEQAKATYNEALRLAVKTNADAQKRAEIYRHMAEIDMAHLDMRQALRNYEQVRTFVPDDEQARRALVEIHYRLSNPVEAVKELDGLLRMFAQQRRGDQIIGTLEQMVNAAPNDMALRSRLAAVYRQTRRDADAISQLDRLGELQLEAGLYQDACATINQIITLKPTDMEQYRNLLAQLGC